MSYRRDGDKITIEITPEQYDSLVFALTLVIHDSGEDLRPQFKRLADAVNDGSYDLGAVPDATGSAAPDATANTSSPNDITAAMLEGDGG